MKESNINNDAWNILKEDERTALSLSLAHGKSTWESGEIMKRAHFKYLEIQKRARKFLEIFTNHFEKYGGLFPEDISMSFAFKEYLILTVLERKHISKAVRQMEDPTYLVASRRTKLITHEIEKLKKMDTESSRDMYGLIMDFDRWNNFRILPLEIQEPSAFKRRNKARNVKHLKKLISLPKYSVFKIINEYSYHGKYSKIYIPIISSYLDDKYKVIQARDKSSTIEKLSKAGLFIFDSRAKADEFGFLVSDYFVDNVKNCKTGQKFWPEFRVLKSETVNFKELENIHKSRTYLDQAWFSQDKAIVKKRKAEVGEVRVDDEKDFYPDKK